VKREHVLAKEEKDSLATTPGHLSSNETNIVAS